MGIYRQATAPAYEAGGLWFDSDDNDKPYYGSGGSWVALNPGSLFTDFSDTDHVQDADVLLGQRGAGGVNYFGSTFVTKNAAGNVGIGTASPTTKLSLGPGIGRKFSVYDAGNINSGLGVDMSGGSYELSIFSGYSGGNGAISFGGYDTSTNTYSQRMRIDSSGNVSVGTAFPSNISGYVALAVNGFIGSFIDFRQNEINCIRIGADGSAGFINGSNGTLRLLTNDVERMRLDSSGNVRPGYDNSQPIGTAAFRWSVVYAGTGSINTSDEREKSDIGGIPDEWLDAWGTVGWSRFKFKEGKRWHIGLIAQRVHAAFAEAGLDAFEIGLCCYDEWEEQREPIFETVKKTRQIEQIVDAGLDEAGNPIKRTEIVNEEYEETVDTGETRVTLEAGNRWGLRYDECFALEAAWQRREIRRMSARLAELEARQ